jgi:hypothetical protein
MVSTWIKLLSAPRKVFLAGREEKRMMLKAWILLSGSAQKVTRQGGYLCRKQRRGGLLSCFKALLALGSFEFMAVVFFVPPILIG